MIWKQFTHLGNFPPELKARFNSFLTTEFDDSLSVEMQLRSIIKWCQGNFKTVDVLIDFINDISNWLKQFENNFDTNLEDSVITVLSEWQASGKLDVVISEALQWQLDEYIITNEQDKLSINQQLTQTEQELTAQLHQIAINVKDFGSVGDGVTDDSQSFKDALNYLVSIGGGTLLVPYTNDAYIINQDVIVNIAENITIEIKGYNSLLKRTSDNKGHILRLVGTLNNTVKISGMCFDGSGVEEQWEEQNFPNLRRITALSTSDVDNVFVDDVKMNNFYGYGLHVNKYNMATTNNVITNNVGGKWLGPDATLYDSFGDSLYFSRALSDTSMVTVSNCSLKGYPDNRPKLSRIGITLEYGAGRVLLQNVIIEGYERTIHSEGVPEIDLTIKDISASRYAIFLFHMGNARSIRVENITLRDNSNVSFGGQSGLVTLYQVSETIPIVHFNNIDMVLKNDVSSTLSGVSDLVLDNIHIEGPKDVAKKVLFNNGRLKIRNSNIISANLTTSNCLLNIDNVSFTGAPHTSNILKIMGGSVNRYFEMNNVRVQNGFIAPENTNGTILNSYFNKDEGFTITGSGGFIRQYALTVTAKNNLFRTTDTFKSYDINYNKPLFIGQENILIDVEGTKVIN